MDFAEKTRTTLAEWSRLRNAIQNELERSFRDSGICENPRVEDFDLNPEGDRFYVRYRDEYHPEESGAVSILAFLIEKAIGF